MGRLFARLLFGDLNFLKNIKLLALVGFGLTGCATVIQGNSQTIEFVIHPPQTQCVIVDSDGLLIATVSFSTNYLKVSKSSDDLTVKCSADQYQDSTVFVKSTAQAIGIFGILIDFGITDMLSGAMWSYPNRVAITLIPDFVIHQSFPPKENPIGSSQ